MSYAENLLDADAVLQKREQSMVKGTQGIVSFLRKLIALDRTHAQSLLKLVKTVDGDGSIDQQAGKVFQNETPSVKQCFLTLQQDTLERGNHLSQVADDMEAVVNVMENWIRDGASTRKTLLERSATIAKEHKEMVAKLATVKRAYVRSCEETEKAVNVALGERVGDAKDGEKKQHRHKAASCLKKAKVAQDVYHKFLIDYNDHCHQHYTKLWPELLNKFEHVEKIRITKLKKHFRKIASLLEPQSELVRRRFQQLMEAANEINSEDDVKTVALSNSTRNAVNTGRVAFEPFDILAIDFVASRTAKFNGKKYVGESLKQPSEGGRDSSHFQVLTDSASMMSADSKNQMFVSKLQDLEEDIKNAQELLAEAKNLAEFYGNCNPAAQLAKEDAKRKGRTVKAMLKSAKNVKFALDALSTPRPEQRTVPIVQQTLKAKHNSTFSFTISAKCVYSYEATVDTELSFQKGERITVLDEDGSGWWYCENKEGDRGFCPQNYLKKEGERDSKSPTTRALKARSSTLPSQATQRGSLKVPSISKSVSKEPVVMGDDDEVDFVDFL